MLLCGDGASLILSSPHLLFHEKMDFGLACHKQTSHPDASFLGLNERRDEKGHGSGLLKHPRSELDEDNNNKNNKNNSSSNNDIWRLPKMPRSGEVDLCFKKASESLISTPFGRSILWSPEDDGEGQKMLSFSSEEPHCGGGGSSRRIEFSLHQDEHHSGAGGIGAIAGGRGSFARPKGPFTPSQWMELEHQALIYKHILANVPIPSNLLLPLKRSSLYSFGSPTSYAPTILGWGPFHLGFSGSNDPEPGRCRRTDGKKWRCSRDAVPDQKYCERHINRGRHRSRKPVEGHTGHSLSGPTTASKAVPPLAGPSPPAAAAANMQQPNSTASASTDYIINRSQEFHGLSLIPPKTTLKHKDTSFPVEKQQPTFQDPPGSEFGIISSNSDLNHFMDWPKDQSHCTTSSPWHEQPKPDWTQLSMSIPDLASSPTRAKPSPFVIPPHELDPIFHMGLGVGRDLDGPAHREEQPGWLPIVWGDPLGGPLGEVLSSQLSGSSPTGVLPKSTFVSLSNSSSGSGSIRRSSGDHRKDSTDNGSLCNDVFGSALLSSAAVQSL